MLVNGALVVCFLPIIVVAHLHGTSESTDGAAHRLLAMPDGKYVCSVCGYVYDPAVLGKSFADEPEDFRCPICTQAKKGFKTWTKDYDSEILCVNNTHHRANGVITTNDAETTDPCATCSYDLLCLPAAQGGMANYINTTSDVATPTTGDTQHKMQAMPDGTYVCSVCGYVHDPRIVGRSFLDEPDTFRCPICTQPKKGFSVWSKDYDSEILCLNNTHHRANGVIMTNKAETTDPCATCSYDLLCLPAAQGGMDKFVGELPPSTADTSNNGASNLTASRSHQHAVCYQILFGALAFVW